MSDDSAPAVADDASASVPAAPCETAAAAAPSKRSLKRAARFAEKDAKKKAKKAARAEDVATRANAGREVAAARLAAMSDEDRAKHFAIIEEKKVERALEKAASDAAFGARCAAGCRIAIDCEFDDLMTEREASSSCQQVMYCYGALKRAEQPSRLDVIDAIADAHAARTPVSASLRTLPRTGKVPAVVAARRP